MPYRPGLMYHRRNQAIFDAMTAQLGKMPNLYATFALNETALPDYLALQNRKSTLSGKEREVINLVVSQVNSCRYCLAAHTTFGKMMGYTDAEVLDIRRGTITWNTKIAALATFVREVTENRGHASEATIETLFGAGYTQANLIDIILVIGDKIISNYLHAVTQIPVDWDAAPAL